MKKAGICKLKNLLLVLSLLALAGCGANSSSVTSPAGVGSASLSAQLEWPANGGSTARAMAVAPGVAKIRLGVTGPTIPSVRKDFDVTGGATSGQLDGIYAGKNLTVTAVALDASGNVLFEGAAFGIDLGEGEAKNIGTISLVNAHTRTADAPCLSCHETVSDKFSGRNVVAEVKKSAHYTNDNAAGCVGCHGANHNDVNPVASGKCFSCHGSLAANHLNAGAIGDGTDARWLNANGTNCNACHQSHNPLKGIGAQERTDWAESAHGDVKGAAWSHYDFTTRDTCNACHTTTGFLKALGNGWTETLKLGTTSTGKEVAQCNACHASNDFKGGIRTVAGGYTAGMGGFGASAKAKVKFSDQGESNICFPCHSGRENGDSLIAGNYNFANKTFVNPHYLGSASVWQGKGGFKFYSSTARYGVDRPTHGVLTADLVSVNHSFTDSRISGAATKGSCVACHLGGKDSHTFDVYQAVKFKSYSSSVAFDGCLGCHSGTNNGRNRYYPTVANGQGSRTSSGGYALARALDFLSWQFAQVGIYFDNTTNPYFFSDPTLRATANQLSNWTTQVAGGTGLQTMGAAMNPKLLATDKGAAAHNATFTKAVIADSLVYLQNGAVGDRATVYADQNQIINFTNYSTAITPAGGGAPKDGNPATVKDLKGFLTKTATGGYVRR